MVQTKQNNSQINENVFSTPHTNENSKWKTWRTAVTDELARRLKNGSDQIRTDRTGTFQAIPTPNKPKL